MWCLPSSPNPISPIPISPKFSSLFALCRLAPYPFCLLPLCPIATSPNHLFTHSPFRLLPIHPLPIVQCHLAPFSFRPFTTSPNAILPIYHLASLSFHHSVSFSPKLLTTAHDFLVEGRGYSYEDLVIHFTSDVLHYSYDYPNPFLA